jgi:hypothetical protein
MNGKPFLLYIPKEVGGVTMFLCQCGGLFMVITIEEYPEGLTGNEKLNYSRMCTVKCSKCEKVKNNQPYD